MIRRKAQRMEKREITVLRSLLLYLIIAFIISTCVCAHPEDGAYYHPTGGHAFVSDEDFTDVNYSTGFSVEFVIEITPYPDASWWGIVTKGDRSSLYSVSSPGWGIGVNGRFSELYAKVGDGDTHLQHSSHHMGRIHYVLAFDGAQKNMTIFVNGKLERAYHDRSLNVSSLATSENFRIGSRGDDYESHDAPIIYVRVWDKDISDEVEDIHSHYESTYSHSLPPTVQTDRLLSQWLMHDYNHTHLFDDVGPNTAELYNSSLNNYSGPLRLVNPGDGSTELDKSITLHAEGGIPMLNESHLPLEFLFELDVDPTFNSSTLRSSGWIPDTPYWKPLLRPNTTYYWRVKAKDSSGNESGFSDTWSFSTEEAQTWFARPQMDTGSYGNDDGRSYEDAWNGLQESVWGVEGIEAGDTLYICGPQVFSLETDRPIVTQAQVLIGSSGLSFEHPITIRMDCPGEEGFLWGYFYDNRNISEGGDAWTGPDENGVYTNTDIMYPNNNIVEYANKSEAIVYEHRQNATWEEDSPGWAEVNDTYYIKTSDASHPRHKVMESLYGYRFHLGRAQYIRFYRANFIGSEFNQILTDDKDYPNPRNLVWDSCTFKNIRGGALLRPRDGNHRWIINNSEFSDASNGVYAVAMEGGVDDIYVGNSRFKDLGNDPFFHQDAHAIGNQGAGSRWIIEGNMISDTGDAIALHPYIGQYTLNTTIRKNFIYRPEERGWGSDGRAISLTGVHGAPYGERSGTKIYNNIAVGCSEYSFMDSTVDKVIFSNNVIFNNLDFAVMAYTQNIGPHLLGRNNLFERDAKLMLFNGNASVEETSLDWNNNIYWGTEGEDFYHKDYGSYWTFEDWKSNLPFDNDSIDVNPNLAGNGDWSDPSDFYPLWDSAVIDAGNTSILNEIGHFKDFNDNPIYGSRDIGAIEYQPPHTIGNDSIEAPSSLRIYGDGSFRYLERSQKSQTVSFSLYPSGGYDSYDDDQIRPALIDMGIKNYSVSYLEWMINISSSHDLNITYTLCDLLSQENYTIMMNDAFLAIIKTDNSGCLITNISTANMTQQQRAAPSDSPHSCIHEAEIIPCDYRLEQEEIKEYLDEWIEGRKTINEVLGAVNVWT